MSERILKYSKSDIDKAGDVLCGKKIDIDINYATEILENFRSIHIHPLNVFRQLLRNKVVGIESEALTSQRLKRFPSIITKLKIQKNMSLSQMQDVGGIRVVLSDLEGVYKLRKILEKSEKQIAFKSKLIKEQDYIKEPKESGYRSLHLIYKYEKNVELEKRCRIELQIRTKIQHAWATAVEVVGTYENQPLKQSFGNEVLLNLFKLISRAFAILENNKKDLELFKKVVDDIERVKLIEKLKGFRVVTNFLESNKSGKYFLITLNFKNQTLDVKRFTESTLDFANEEYTRLEKAYMNNPNMEVVFVSVDDINNLKKLYPNYFLDTEDFLIYIERIKFRVQQLVQ